jgi:hypothetical protein
MRMTYELKIVLFGIIAGMALMLISSVSDSVGCGPPPQCPPCYSWNGSQCVGGCPCACWTCDASRNSCVLWGCGPNDLCCTNIYTGECRCCNWKNCQDCNILDGTCMSACNPNLCQDCNQTTGQCYVRCDANECEECVEGMCQNCLERYGLCCACENGSCIPCPCWDKGGPIEGSIDVGTDIALCQSTWFQSWITDRDHYRVDCPYSYDEYPYDGIFYSWDQSPGSNPSTGTYTPPTNEPYVYWQAPSCIGTI